ncbi:hypothetical protein B0H10DRAFT_1941394 [Mycena sp. CBHHK59/15]|nr:hypothetical protein B0H10DRAFT_1941394 [Mycena sp. CBHHK59/15]
MTILGDGSQVRDCDHMGHDRILSKLMILRRVFGLERLGGSEEKNTKRHVNDRFELSNWFSPNFSWLLLNRDYQPDFDCVLNLKHAALPVLCAEATWANTGYPCISAHFRGSYCSQSSRYSTPTKASRLVELEPVLEAARKAKANGSTRFCMGAAWRDLAGRKRGFERILEMVREVRGMDMEVITTRSYDERLDTITAVRDAGISVCSGGILGLGESDEDRVGLIWEVSNMPEHPESFPVNALVPIPGTPLEGNEVVKYHVLLRTIATARIVLPTTIIRLAAGRNTLAESEQAMCFMAGANAVFTGEQMLTTPCSPWDEDKAMMGRWGLAGMQSFEQTSVARKEGLNLEGSPASTSCTGMSTTEAARPPLTNGKRRPEDPAFPVLPLSDQNFWYYPAHGSTSDDDDTCGAFNGGNWGAKTKKRARWARRGKITSWGPGAGEWEFRQEEERARKRMKLLLPQERRSPSPPSLPHLSRSLSPPIQSPYPPPTSQHLSFSSFVMDKAVTHTFRSSLLDELEHATNGLIEGEGTMRKALGRLWQVISEDTDPSSPTMVVPKQEDEDEDAEELDDVAKRLARAPDLTVAAHKLFLWSYANGGGPPVYEHSHFASPETQMESLEKTTVESTRATRGDQRRIRGCEGTAERNMEFVREKAVEELQEVAFSTVIIHDPGPPSQSVSDRELLKYREYVRSLPYSIEPESKLVEMIDFIVLRITQCCVARDYEVGLIQWDSMLWYYMSLKYPIAKVGGVCSRFVAVLTFSRPNGSSWLNLLLPEHHPRQLPWVMGYIAANSRRFFHPAAANEMLSVFVPLINGTDLNGVLAAQFYLLTFLPLSHPQTYLPMLFRLWESINSYMFDERMLDFLACLTEMHVASDISDPRKITELPDDARSEGEGRPQWSEDDLNTTSVWPGIYKDVGVFTEHEWNLIMCKCINSMEIPLADGGSLTTGPSADRGVAAEIGRLPKPEWRIQSLARIIVYSMAPDGIPSPASNAPTPIFTPVPSGMTTPRIPTNSLRDYLSAPLARVAAGISKSKTYLAGSKALESLSQIIASTESFFHPSNSGPFTADNRRLTKQMRRELVKTLRTVAFLAMFSEDSTTVGNIQSCLKSMSVMEPDLILHPILERAVPALETLIETQRTIAVIKALGAAAPAIVSRRVYYPGAKYLVPILQLLIPGIDLLHTTEFIVEVSQYIMFADAMPVHFDPASIAPSATPQTLMPSFSMVDVQSDMEFPRLSDEEEDMLVKDTTGSFADWVTQFIRRVYQLQESLPEEGGGASEVQVVDAVGRACQSICAHLSEPLYDLVLNMVYDYASTNALANADPVKCLAKFFPLCARNIRIELENGASSLRTTSVSSPIPSDATLHWYLAILRGCIYNQLSDGNSVLPYKDELVSLLQLLHDKTYSNRGFAWSGKLLCSFLAHSEQEEIEFAILIFKELVEPTLVMLEDLLNPGAPRNAVWSNNFCRNAFSGIPTLIKDVFDGDALRAAFVTSDILNEIEEMIGIIEPMESGFVLTDPTDPRYEYMSSLRRRFGEFLHSASKSLSQQGEENTVDAVEMLIEGIRTYMLEYGDSKDGYYTNEKKYTSGRYYHSARLHWNSIERLRGPLEDLLIDDLVDWSLWNYATIRSCIVVTNLMSFGKYAASGLNSLTEPCFLVYDVATPALDRILAASELGEEQRQIIRKCAESRIRRVRLMNEAANELTAIVLTIGNSPKTHWRYEIAAIRCLRTLIRRDAALTPEQIRYFMEKTYDSNPSMRYYAQRASMKSLRNVKLRTLALEPADLILNRNHNPLEQNITVKPSHELTKKILDAYKTPLDLRHVPQEPLFLDKDPPGWLAWGNSVALYKPPDSTQSTFQPWERLSEKAIAAVREIAVTASFWKQLAMYFSEENHEVAIIVDNVSYVKSICLSPLLTPSLLTYRSLVQLVEDAPFEALKPTLDQLISDKEPDKQRALAEFMAGLIGGSKHWPLTKQHVLWEWFKPILVNIFSQNLKTDTVTIWASFLEACTMFYVFHKKDPRRLQPLVDHLMKLWATMEYEPELAFDATKIFTVFKAFYEELDWKFTAWTDEVVERCWAQVDTNEHDDVRAFIADMLVFSGKIRARAQPRPSCPTTEVFVRECRILPTDYDIMGMRGYYHKGRVVELVKKFQVWREERIPGVRAFQSVYDRSKSFLKVGITVCKWFFRVLLDTSAISVFDYILPLMPELFRFTEVNDNETLQERANDVLVQMCGVNPPRSLINLIFDAIFDTIQNSPSWKVRLKALPLVQVFYFRQLPLIAEAKVVEILEVLCKCLDDEVVDVREMAATLVHTVWNLKVISSAAHHHLADLKHDCRIDSFSSSKRVTFHLEETRLCQGCAAASCGHSGYLRIG